VAVRSTGSYNYPEIAPETWEISSSYVALDQPSLYPAADAYPFLYSGRMPESGRYPYYPAMQRWHMPRLTLGLTLL